MSMLQHNLIDFSVEAYHDGALETIGKEDLLGHWSVLFFYPADFSFVCPTELEGHAGSLRRVQEGRL